MQRNHDDDNDDDDDDDDDVDAFYTHKCTSKFSLAILSNCFNIFSALTFVI